MVKCICICSHFVRLSNIYLGNYSHIFRSTCLLWLLWHGCIFYFKKKINPDLLSHTTEMCSSRDCEFKSWWCQILIVFSGGGILSPLSITVRLAVHELVCGGGWIELLCYATPDVVWEPVWKDGVMCLRGRT